MSHTTGLYESVSNSMYLNLYFPNSHVMGYTKRGMLLRLAATISTLYTLTFTTFMAVRTCKASYTTHHTSDGKKQSSVKNFSQHLFTDQITNSRAVFTTCFYWRTTGVLYTTTLPSTVIVSLHILAWVWMSACVLLTDPAELFGFKQIWYEEKGLHAPIYYKSEGAQRVLSHYRHPHAVGPLILLFTCPL
eukprot:sb/3471159/